jgi:hypothetical protein
LQLLRELIPNAALFGVLGNASADLQGAARTLGLQLIIENPGNDRELETAFAAFSQQRARGVLVPNGPLYNRRMSQLAALAWISQTYRCIGAENLRKLLCCNNFSQVQEHPDADRVYVGAV